MREEGWAAEEEEGQHMGQAHSLLVGQALPLFLPLYFISACRKGGRQGRTRAMGQAHSLLVGQALSSFCHSTSSVLQ